MRHSTVTVRRVLAGASIFILMLASASSASADECALTDPDCVLATVDETVGSTKAQAEDTTQSVVGEAERQVGGLLGDGGGDPPGEPSPDGGGDPRPDDPGKRDARRGNDPGNGGRQGGSRSRGESPAPVPHRGLIADAIPPGLVAETVGAGGVIDRLAEAGATAAKSLGLLLALAGLVVGFVLIQDRLDRRDPKLALAPLESDDLRFI